MALLNQDNSALKGLLNSPLGARCSQAYLYDDGPVPTACPWLTPAERDNQGFATLTVNVAGFDDIHLNGDIAIPCSWGGSPVALSLAVGYWDFQSNDPFFSGLDASYKKAFGNGPAGAYTLVEIFSGTAPGIVIVTVP